MPKIEAQISDEMYNALCSAIKLGIYANISEAISKNLEISNLQREH